MLEIIKPFNAHLHLRRGEMLRLVLPHTVRQFRYATVMPNTLPGIYTADDIVRYRKEIETAVDQIRDDDGVDYAFEPIMVLYITPQTTPEMVEAAFDAGAKAGKLYPRGGTTNSADGIEYYWPLYNVFKAMERLGMLLLIHGEVIRYEEDVRELMFLPILDEIAMELPGLKIVLEHISNYESVEAVKRHRNVAATITLHHLLLTATDMMGEKFQAHKYWKPRPKKAHDRNHLVEAALSGDPRFFYGTDSAPHPIGAKHAAECCAGVFSEPVALAALAGLFDRHHAMSKLEPFTSQFGLAWYGMPVDGSDTIILKPKDWLVPETYGEGALTVVPFMAGQTMSWTIQQPSS